METTKIIEELKKLSEYHFFSVNKWEERGLNPSSNKIIKGLEEKASSCIDILIQAILKNGNNGIEDIVTKELNNFSSDQYDTEEKEFIGDFFVRISTILHISIAKELDTLLYGSEVSTMVNDVENVDSKQKIVLCQKCKTKIGVKINKVNNNIPNHWLILECNQCKELNLMFFR